MRTKKARPCRRVLGLVALLATSQWLWADLVTDWNALFLEAVRNETTPPPLAARNLAILHAAVYDAANSIVGTHTPYYYAPTAPISASLEAAITSAAHQIAVSLYPSRAAQFDAYLNSSLAAVPEGPLRTAGLGLGTEAANALLGLRAADGASTTVPYIPSTDPGAWRRTPPFFRPPELPQWRYVTPFALNGAGQFRPPGPPALASARYASDFNQVKELGAKNSTARTAEQTQTAIFWSDFSYTVTPPGHWNEIARIVASEAHISLWENARLFALLNLAMADAGIATWDAKYEYNFWRPVTAIQQAELDGNPDTSADPAWEPLLLTPAFPEYVSGHSAFSAAAGIVLAAFFGTDQTSFTIGSDTLPGVFRTYTSFEAAAEEIGWSRIYGGIHFLSADLDGLDLGHDIGQYVTDHFLVAIPEPSTAILLALGAGLMLIPRLRGRRPGPIHNSPIHNSLGKSPARVYEDRVL